MWPTVAGVVVCLLAARVTACTDLTNLFPDGTWVSADAAVFSSAQMDIVNGTNGDVATMQTLGIVATSDAAGNVGACESITIVAPTITRAGLNTAAGDAPSQFNLAINVRMPIKIVRTQAVGHLPQHSIGLTVAACDLTAPERATAAAAALTPSIIAALGTLNQTNPAIPGRLLREAVTTHGISAASTRREILDSLFAEFPHDALTEIDALLRDTQLQLSAIVEPHAAIGHDASARGSGHPGAPHMRRHVLPAMSGKALRRELQPGPSAERRVQFLGPLVDDIPAIAAATLEGITETRIRSIRNQMNGISANVAAAQASMTFQNTTLANVNAALNASLTAELLNNKAINATITSAGVFEKLLSTSNGEAATFSNLASSIANTSANNVKATADTLRAINTQFENKTNALAAVVAAAFNSTMAGLGVIARAMNRSGDAEADLIRQIATGARASLTGTASLLDANEVILRMFFRAITDYVTRVRHLAVLSPKFHSIVQTMQTYGFTPFVGADFAASVPGPSDAWTTTSPLRAVNISTVLYLRTVLPAGTPTDVYSNTTTTHVVVQDRVVIQCDPVVGIGFLTQSAVGIDFIDAFASASNNAVCSTPAQQSAAPAPPCICWAVVDQQQCPTVLTSPDDSIVAAATNGPDHARVLTAAGIVGWSTPVNRSDVGVLPQVPPQAAAPPGYAAATPCAVAPTVTTAPKVITDQQEFLAFLAAIQCNPLNTTRDITAGTSTTAIPLGDVYVASPVTSASNGFGPYLQPIPLVNGLRLTGSAGAGASYTNMYTASKQAGMPSAYPSAECSVDARVAATLTGANASPMTVFLSLMMQSWGVNSATFRFAQAQAFGYLTSDVVQDVNPTYYERTAGRTTTCMSAEIAMTQGNWEPLAIGVADPIAVFAEVATQEVVAPGVTLPVTRSSTTIGRVTGPFLGTIPSRFPVVGAIECIATDNCTLPMTGANAGGHPTTGSYTYDLPATELPLAEAAVQRANSLTYMLDTRAPTLRLLNVSDGVTPALTLDEWVTTNGGDAFNAAARAGTLQNSVRVLAHIPQRCGPRLGLSDKVCKGDLPEGGPCLAEARVHNKPLSVAKGGMCFKMRHNVFFTPDVTGADAWVVGTPYEACGRGDTQCWVPRQFTVVLPEFSVPVGARSLAAVVSCPTVRTVLASVTGFPIIDFRNPGDVALAAWSYRFVFMGVNDTVDNLALNVTQRTQLCVNGSLTSGPPLAPGATHAVMWPSMCAQWRIEVYQTQAGGAAAIATPCNVHVATLRVNLPTVVVYPGNSSSSSTGGVPADDDGSSSSSSSTAGGWRPNVPAAASITYIVPGINTTVSDAVGAAQEVAAAAADTQLAVFGVRSHAMIVWASAVGVAANVDVQLAAKNMTAAAVVANSLLTTATNVTINIGPLVQASTTLVATMGTVATGLAAVVANTIPTINFLSNSITSLLNASNENLANASAFNDLAKEFGYNASVALSASRAELDALRSPEVASNMTALSNATAAAITLYNLNQAHAASIETIKTQLATLKARNKFPGPDGVAFIVIGTLVLAALVGLAIWKSARVRKWLHIPDDFPNHRAGYTQVDTLGIEMQATAAATSPSYVRPSGVRGPQQSKVGLGAPMQV
jgi:hypothetical protein